MDVALMLDLDGQRVVCVGAGPVAAAKALPLLAAGADLVVVAPQADPAFSAAAAAASLTWRPRRYRSGDLDGALLVIAATGAARVDGRVAADAAAKPVPCVRIDGAGSAALPATVRRGQLLFAVSTGRGAPALAARLRRRLEAEYGPEWGEVARILGELRGAPRVRDALRDVDATERRRRWLAALDALLPHGRPDPHPVAATERALEQLGTPTDQSISLR